MIPVIYQAESSKPYLVLKDQEMADYFASCRGGTPEAPLIEWAKTLLNWSKHPYFIDVGMHVGTWYHEFLHAGAYVSGFEPNPQICNLAKTAHVLNSWGNAFGHIHWRALSDNTAMRTLNVPHEDGGGGSLVRNDMKVVYRIDVPVSTLDDVWRELFKQPIDLIKIDVEGAELDVLRGARQLIWNDRPKIIFECWEDERGQRKEELFRYLHDELDYKTTKTSWPEVWLAEPKDIS